MQPDRQDRGLLPGFRVHDSPRVPRHEVCIRRSDPFLFETTLNGMKGLCAIRAQNSDPVDILCTHSRLCWDGALPGFLATDERCFPFLRFVVTPLC